MRFHYLLPLLMLPAVALAEAPNIQTPSPVLFLADNLDEPDQLGYCLDTVGRGQSDRAHIHSCKLRGGDVQFRYDSESQQIQSATFANICLDIADDVFALVTCSDAKSQKFDFHEITGEFRIASDTSLCLTSGENSRQAGPFMARDLVIANCAATPEALKSWVQRY